MPSTNQTPNLGLSQWEPEDYVLREDFNSDNIKIDNAIKDATMMTKITEYTTTSSAAQINIDMTGIDWTKYHYIYIDVAAKFAGSEPIAVVFANNTPEVFNSFRIYDNNTTMLTAFHGNSLAHVYKAKEPFRIILPVLKNPERQITVEYNPPFGYICGYPKYAQSIKFQQLTSINLKESSSGNYLTGTKITIWGA